MYRAVRNVLNEYGLNETKVEEIIKKEVEHYMIKHIHGMLASETFNDKFTRIVNDALNKEMKLKPCDGLQFKLRNIVKEWISEKLEKIVKLSVETNKE